jgi:hypothetical protein
MQWATGTSTVIKCLFEVNAIFIKLRGTRWATRCFYHTLPTLILLTPGVHFLANMESVCQLSADNSNSFVCCTTLVYCTWVTESMNTRRVDSGRQLASSVYARDAHIPARTRHCFLSSKVLVKKTIFSHLSCTGGWKWTAFQKVFFLTEELLTNWNKPTVLGWTEMRSRQTT